MKIEDRRLFLKYALPCAGTLVKRGDVKKEYVDQLIGIVSDGNVPEEDAESMFKIANAMCGKIAERMGKKTVDTEVIRTYFLLEHSDVVDDRYALMGDFNPVDCKTYAGTVTQKDGDYATVETRLGRKRYRTAFTRDLKEKDRVVVHWDFIVEKAPKFFVEKMGVADK